MTSDVVLRDVTEADLPLFFDHQRDPDANRMAAFPARDREAFMEHWKKILGNETGITRTIVAGGQVVGNVVCWEQAGERYVGYWLGRAFWGKGIATRALAAFLRILKMRPLHAHVAKHNLGSLRVLEKCGFTVSGEDKVPSGVPGEEVEELILTLAANERDEAQ